MIKSIVVKVAEFKCDSCGGHWNTPGEHQSEVEFCPFCGFNMNTLAGKLNKKPAANYPHPNMVPPETLFKPIYQQPIQHSYPIQQRTILYRLVNWCTDSVRFDPTSPIFYYPSASAVDDRRLILLHLTGDRLVIGFVTADPKLVKQRKLEVIIDNHSLLIPVKDIKRYQYPARVSSESPKFDIALIPRQDTKLVKYDLNIGQSLQLYAEQPQSPVTKENANYTSQFYNGKPVQITSDDGVKRMGYVLDLELIPGREQWILGNHGITNHYMLVTFSQFSALIPQSRIDLSFDFLNLFIGIENGENSRELYNFKPIYQEYLSLSKI